MATDKQGMAAIDWQHVVGLYKNGTDQETEWHLICNLKMFIFQNERSDRYECRHAL